MYKRQLLTLSGHLRTLAALQKVRPDSGRLDDQVERHETHISAQQNKTRTHPRFSCSHGNQSRARCVETPPRKRAFAVGAVTESASDATKSPPSGLTCRPGNRFGKDSRLLDAAAFGRVFEKATRSRDEFFTVLCRRNEIGVARLGLAISKKNCRRATARNRVKRVVRESFRGQQESLKGLDVVVINQPAAATATNQRLFASLNGHWRRCRKANRIR